MRQCFLQVCGYCDICLQNVEFPSEARDEVDAEVVGEAEPKLDIALAIDLPVAFAKALALAPAEARTSPLASVSASILAFCHDLNLLMVQLLLIFYASETI